MFRPSIRFWASGLIAIVLSILLYLAGNRGTRIQGEEDISEAVFRKLLEMPDVSHYPLASGVCISNEGRRFSRTFLERFKEKFPKLTYAAKISATASPKTPRCAVVLSIDDIHWINDTEVSVNAGYSCGPLCGYGGQFHMRRSGRGWYVDEMNPVFISRFLFGASFWRVQMRL